jgi:hypothetical protein
MDVDGGFDGRFYSWFDGGLYSWFDGWLMVGSTWLCWAINLSKAFDSSDERLNELVVL